MRTPSGNSIPISKIVPKTRVVHCKKEPYDIYIGRPSIWGNPFHMRNEGDRSRVIEEYAKYIRQRRDLLMRIGDLRGKRLGCWCSPKPCHGDILCELADFKDRA
jgi:hypothetical protein